MQSNNPSNDPQELPQYLVVDDEQSILDLFRLYFADKAGITVAENVEEALVKINSHNFDVIICDVAMPGPCGISLFKKLHGSDPEISRRFIFCSGSYPPELNCLCTKHQIGFISKPIQFEQLQEQLARISRPEISAPAQPR